MKTGGLWRKPPHFKVAKQDDFSKRQPNPLIFTQEQNVAEASLRAQFGQPIRTRF